MSNDAQQAIGTIGIHPIRGGQRRSHSGFARTVFAMAQRANSVVSDHAIALDGRQRIRGHSGHRRRLAVRKLRELHALEAAAVLGEIRATPEEQTGDAGDHPEIHWLKTFHRIGLLAQNGGVQLGDVVVFTTIQPRGGIRSFLGIAHWASSFLTGASGRSPEDFKLRK